MALPTTNRTEHYIAGTGESVTGSLVDSWADQSGNGYVATGTTTTRPTKTTDAQGRPIVRFPVNSLCRLLSNGPIYSTRAISVWIVARVARQNGNGAFVGVQGAAFPPLRMNVTTAIPATLYAGNSISSGFRVPMNLGVYGSACGATTSVVHDAFGSTSGAAVGAATGTGGIEIAAIAGASALAMDVYEVIVYSAQQSAQDQADTKAYLVAKYGIPTTPRTKIAVFDGDSITQGTGSTDSQTWPFILACTSAIEQNWSLYNIGVNGQTVSGLVNRQAATIALLSGSETEKVYGLLIGRNDAAAASTAAEIYASIVSLLQGVVTGVPTVKVWGGTPIATQATAIDDKLATLSATIRSSLQTDVPSTTRINDFRALPQFDEQADASDTTYYAGDGTHLTNAGNVLMAGVVSPALLASSSPAPYFSGFGSGFGF